MERYVEQHSAQVSKSGQPVCGDHWIVQRTDEDTVAILTDGIGSGAYANVAAITCASRLSELLSGGVPIREACGRVADSMHRARTEDIPYCAFTVVRVLRNGQFTAVSFDAPAPVLLRDGKAQVAKLQYSALGYELVGEVAGTLRNGEAIAFFSDGVSQAGIGRTHALGWGSEGVAAFLTRRLSVATAPARLPEAILTETERLCGGIHPDDATFLLLSCRPASVVHVMSGPPSARLFDRAFVDRFMEAEGAKVLCGSSTTDMVSRLLDRKAEPLPFRTSPSSPPEYRMEGMDLVTEGAATLSQAANILDVDLDTIDEESAVTSLVRLLRAADKIHFHVGGARNVGHNGVAFRQLGVRPRQDTIEDMARQLRAMGKLVTVLHV